MAVRTNIPCICCGRERWVEKHEADRPCQQCQRIYQAFHTPLGPWIADALCPEVDAEMFYPAHGKGDNADPSVREAKAVCARCDVRTECLTYALEADEQYGIWGGLTAHERRRLKKGNAA